MDLSRHTSIGEIAVAIPDATRVFEKYKIDYCCGGRRSLAEACKDASVDVETIVASIEQSQSYKERTLAGADWGTRPLRELIRHILDTHHVFTREELPRLRALVDKVYSVHGERHPELARVFELFGQLEGDLYPHLLKEEQMLFPYVAQMEETVEQGADPQPPPFGSVRNPVRMMMMEHDAAGEILAELRSITSDYTAPEDGCMSYRTLYGALAGFEADLHQHIHLENNALFPRAVALEEEVLAKVSW